MSIVFPSWGEANKDGFQARGLWRDMGFTVRKGEKAYAEVDNEEFHECKVYHRDQVRQLKEPQKSKRILIGRFLGQCDWFAIRDHGTGRISQHHSLELRGSLKDLAYKTFLYKNRTTGIRIPLFWREKKRAEGLDFRASEKTRYVVLDIDSHHPTEASTEAHLLLLKKLVSLLPRLVGFLRATSVFFDYRQDAPRGIHIWIYFRYPRDTKTLHERIRTFLMSNADAELDKQLRSNGLKEMGSLEILPSESHCMRFFGGYERRVFTTKELKPTKHGFDAESLLLHLDGPRQIGDPCHRYGELARAGLGLEQEDKPPVAVCSRILELTSDKPSKRGNFFVFLIDACLNGVNEPDELYGVYLVPIATALYYRDFHGDPKRNEKVVNALMGWLERKNNGQVSRIKDDQKSDLLRCIRGIVRKLSNTPDKVRQFWDSVRQRDLAHPNHRIRLAKCMETVLDQPFTVTKENLSQIRQMVEGVQVINSPVTRRINLPGTVEQRLRHHLAKAGRSPGKRTDRIVTFAERLIQEIGVLGNRTISSARINELASLGKGRKSAGKYKTLLVGADILKPDWDHAIMVGKHCSHYRLVDWVVEHIRHE